MKTNIPQVSEIKEMKRNNWFLIITLILFSSLLSIIGTYCFLTMEKEDGGFLEKEKTDLILDKDYEIDKCKEIVKIIAHRSWINYCGSNGYGIIRDLSPGLEERKMVYDCFSVSEDQPIEELFAKKDEIIEQLKKGETWCESYNEGKGFFKETSFALELEVLEIHHLFDIW